VNRDVHHTFSWISYLVDKSVLVPVGSSNFTEILAPVVQGVAVLVVNLPATRTEVFVHANVRTINPCNPAEPAPSIRTYVPVMSPHLSKSFRDTRHSRIVPSRRSRKITAVTTTKCESVWTLQGATNVPMNISKRLTHYITVSSIAFRRNLRLPTAPHMHRLEGFGPWPFLCGECSCIYPLRSQMSSRSPLVLV